MEDAKLLCSSYKHLIKFSNHLFAPSLIGRKYSTQSTL
ncbi:hypothetical protein CEV34_2854 [Brucella pseudogrignonensis]|uniref:Uncharacterized protein n=1 Tax=Brucella pseudogrignonensis TaxID=419475 RepID=A0A256GDX0_9HYPH|nr:hypothetical protein CEV34_2854 [Brucella pseudogrignonensis]